MCERKLCDDETDGNFEEVIFQLAFTIFLKQYMSFYEHFVICHWMRSFKNYRIKYRHFPHSVHEFPFCSKYYDLPFKIIFQY